MDKVIQANAFNAFNGEFNLIYLTPEKFILCKNEILDLHCTKPLGAVMDEIHCIITCGFKEYRPTFKHIIPIISRLTLDIPFLGLTATPPGGSTDLLVDELNLDHPFIHKKIFA